MSHGLIPYAGTLDTTTQTYLTFLNFAETTTLS
jgi:hypothetical protein